MRAAITLWTACVMGEAAKLVPGGLSPSEVAGRSFPPCAALEAIVVEESKPAPVTELREAVSSSIETGLLRMREALKLQPESGAPDASEPEP